MRYVNIVLCLLMLLFIGVQYNDPDGPMWMLIYAVPALWAGAAALRPRQLAAPLPRGLLLGCVAAALLGVVYYWPDTPRWWASEVWYEVETAREGMGMMIVAVVMAIVWAGLRRGGREAEPGVGQGAGRRASAERPPA